MASSREVEEEEMKEGGGIKSRRDDETKNWFREPLIFFHREDLWRHRSSSIRK